MLQQVTNALIINWLMLCGPGSRQSRLHHQRSTRGFTVSEMESFEIPYASIVIGVRVFTQGIQYIAVWNWIPITFLALGSMLSGHCIRDRVLILKCIWNRCKIKWKDSPQLNYPVSSISSTGFKLSYLNKTNDSLQFPSSKTSFVFWCSWI